MDSQRREEGGQCFFRPWLTPSLIAGHNPELPRGVQIRENRAGTFHLALHFIQRRSNWFTVRATSIVAALLGRGCRLNTRAGASFHNQSTWRDHARDFSVSELAQYSPEIPVNGFFPQFLP